MPKLVNEDTDLFAGQGYVMFAERDANGNPGDFTLAGNVDTLTPAFAISKAEKRENMTGQRGILATRINEQTLNLAMDWSSWSPANIALGLRADVTNVAPAGGTVKLKRTVGPGNLIALEHLGATGVTVVDDPDKLPTPGTNTYTEDAAADGSGDFLVDAERALIRFNPVSPTGLTAGTEVEIEYTPGTQTVIESLTKNVSEVWLRYVGINVADNDRPIMADFYKFEAELLSELALITPTDWANFTMNGTAVLDPLRATGSQYFTWKYLD